MPPPADSGDDAAPGAGQRARRSKRVIDVTLVTILLMVTAPLMAAIAILIKATSVGPVLFRQTRSGLALRPFTILKFRTMVPDAERRREALLPLNEARGIIFKIQADPRLTRLGGVLRQLSLDELPQLINVLRGEMSLVGTRPLPDWVVSQIDQPRAHRRFSVLPGMTGQWQVFGRVQDSNRMLDDDLYYVDHWSLWLDIRILASTPWAVLQNAGRIASTVTTEPGASREMTSPDES